MSNSNSNSNNGAAQNSLLRNSGANGVRLDVTPESADWTYLSFRVVFLAAGETYTDVRPGQETAIVPLQGSAAVTAGAARRIDKYLHILIYCEI